MSDNNDERQEVATVVKFEIFPSNGADGVLRQIDPGLSPLLLIEPEAGYDDLGEEVVTIKFTCSLLGNDIHDAVEALEEFTRVIRQGLGERDEEADQ